MAKIANKNQSILEKGNEMITWVCHLVTDKMNSLNPIKISDSIIEKNIGKTGAILKTMLIGEEEDCMCQVVSVYAGTEKINLGETVKGLKEILKFADKKKVKDIRISSFGLPVDSENFKKVFNALNTVLDDRVTFYEYVPCIADIKSKSSLTVFGESDGIEAVARGPVKETPFAFIVDGTPEVKYEVVAGILDKYVMTPGKNGNTLQNATTFIIRDGVEGVPAHVAKYAKINGIRVIKVSMTKKASSMDERCMVKMMNVAKQYGNQRALIIGGKTDKNDTALVTYNIAEQYNIVSKLIMLD